MAFTVADYILQRLGEQNVDTLFGVPAAYCRRCSTPQSHAA
jgi:indolepyruvate decarboxylase